MAAGILPEPQDWQLLVDLEKQLRFPQHIVSITLRPDIQYLCLRGHEEHHHHGANGAMGGLIGGGPREEADQV